MSAKSDSGLKIQSSAFSHGGYIPPRYTCEGENVNPPLEVTDLPKDTKSLALIVEDPDAPKGVYDHWVVWNILPTSALEKTPDPALVVKTVLVRKVTEGLALLPVLTGIFLRCMHWTAI
jgi:Raf kinase inhibitor-like YbhB/YbcL family protein